MLLIIYIPVTRARETNRQGEGGGAGEDEPARGRKGRKTEKEKATSGTLGTASRAPKP